MTASDRGDVQAVQLLLSAGSDIYMLDRVRELVFYMHFSNTLYSIDC